MDSAIHSPFVFVTHALNRTNMYITLFIMVTKPTSVQACSCRLDLRLSALVLVCQKQHREPLPAAWNHKGNPVFEIPALETSWNADSMTCCVDVNSRNPGNSWDAGGLESRQGGVALGGTQDSLVTPNHTNNKINKNKKNNNHTNHNKQRDHLYVRAFMRVFSNCKSFEAKQYDEKTCWALVELIYVERKHIVVISFIIMNVVVWWL